MTDTTQTIPDDLRAWVDAGARGASAGSIAAHLRGYGEQDGSYPLDDGDFGRCEALLNAAPALRAELPRMAEVNAYWAAIAPQWNKIKAADDRTGMIRDITRPIEREDPGHVQIRDGISICAGANIFGAIREANEEALFRQAVHLVWQEGKASTSFIQRKLGISYNLAAHLIEKMEEMKVVSPANHVGKRTINSPDDLRAALNIRKEVMDIAGEEQGRIMLDAIVTGMKASEAARRKAQGKPPMKPDPSFDTAADNTYKVTANELRQFVERIEQLDAEKKDLAEQQKDVMAEAKSRGYDTKILRKVIALRKREPDDIAEEEAVLAMYKEALGM
jgi:uncharacterized protein (UPF0335 family)